MLDRNVEPHSLENGLSEKSRECVVDAYFSADVETDGPIPGPFSMLSFALVYAGSFDGKLFTRPGSYGDTFYRELKPISEQFQIEALQVNGLDRNRLLIEGAIPAHAMTEASRWIRSIAGQAKPVLVAYPLSFDWAWLYWYFVRFSEDGSPFGYSRCFDLKTALSIKSSVPIAASGRSRIAAPLRPTRQHTHHALDDAIEQAEIFANVFEWEGSRGGAY
ncbi:MAG TPA: 3'-5' exoribonuclease [Candidatus Acidoferrales bacterium]